MLQPALLSTLYIAPVKLLSGQLKVLNNVVTTLYIAVVLMYSGNCNVVNNVTFPGQWQCLVDYNTGHVGNFYRVVYFLYCAVLYFDDKIFTGLYIFVI